MSHVLFSERSRELAIAIRVVLEGSLEQVMHPGRPRIGQMDA